MAKTFVLNDEKKVNSYGFKVLNSGINLDRFKANPVMLSNHWNNTDNVIGRWENIRIEGSQLLADAVFDENDEDAKKIASKVEGEFLKGCSMGIRYSYEFMEEKPDGTYILTVSELFEVSIVAVPSNANAVKLYSASGELLDEDQITLSLSEIKSKTEKSNSNNTMSKLLLSAVTVTMLMAYGLKNADSPEEVDNAVAKLKAELDAEKNGHLLEKTKREQLEAQISQQEASNLSVMLDQAITDGQILAAQRETFSALGYQAAKSIIDGLPKKVSLSGQIGSQSVAGAADPKTSEEFFALSQDDQLAFKNSNPSGYQKLFA